MMKWQVIIFYICLAAMVRCNPVNITNDIETKVKNVSSNQTDTTRRDDLTTSLDDTTSTTRRDDVTTSFDDTTPTKRQDNLPTSLDDTTSTKRRDDLSTSSDGNITTTEMSSSDHPTTTTKPRDFCVNPVTEPHRILPEGDDSKGICYDFKMSDCVASAAARGVPKWMEPNCYPKIVRCRKNLCSNTFGLRQDCLSYQLDGWMRNLLYSGCADPPSQLVNPKNVGICKYADTIKFNIRRLWSTDAVKEGMGKDVFDFAKCFCTGALCNKFDNYTEVFILKSDFGPFEPLRPVQDICPTTTTAAPLENQTAHTQGDPTPQTLPQGTSNKENIINIVSIVFGTCSTLTLLALGIRRCLRSKFSKSFSSVTSETSNTNSDFVSGGESSSSKRDDDFEIDDVDFKGSVVLKQGKYGKLYLVKRHDLRRTLIAKVYDKKDLKYYTSEVRIYTYPGVSHENVLHYFGSQERRNECVVVLEYQPNGSLQEYLRGHTVSWNMMVNIMHTMVRGLAHLHTPIMLTEANSIKHPIAHGDIKSGNILLDDKLQAKIADFNLARVLESCKLNEETDMERFGTPRYMSPELLSGQSDRRREILLQSDVYSMALVMWEVFSCCQINPSVQDGYRQPYHEYVKDKPSIEELYQVVYVDDKRPKFSENITNPVVEELVSMISDSWEKDGYLRLTAPCIETKLKALCDDTSIGIINTSYV